MHALALFASIVIMAAILGLCSAVAGCANWVKQDASAIPAHVTNEEIRRHGIVPPPRGSMRISFPKCEPPRPVNYNPNP